MLSVFVLSGELKTLLPLDREEVEVHKMKVRALDGGGRFCEAEVEITVEDVNDNAPQFTSDPYTFTVFENTEINTPVARLYASDLDTGKISSIQYNDIFMSLLCVLVSVFPKIFSNFATVWPVGCGSTLER